MPKGKRADILIMNPPYLGENRNDYNFPLKFLNKVIEFSDRVVSIQPIMFLFKTYDRKSPEKTEKEILSTVERYGCNVEEMKNNTFDAFFGNKIGIIDIDTSKQQNIIVDGKIYNSTKEINKFSHDKLLVEFNNIISKLYKNDNIVNHWHYVDNRNIKAVKQQELDSNSTDYFVDVAQIRGNKGSDDMSTIIPKDRKPQYGNRTTHYINFNTKEEAENFINYCKTDFATACVYLFKLDIALAQNLNYVPWFDFSDPHFSKSPREIDDWLFKKYNISDEIRKHIEEILPDYYGIRKEDYLYKKQ